MKQIGVKSSAWQFAVYVAVGNMGVAFSNISTGSIPAFLVGRPWDECQPRNSFGAGGMIRR